mgnify:CR=1 FL=1
MICKKCAPFLPCDDAVFFANFLLGQLCQPFSLCCNQFLPFGVLVQLYPTRNSLHIGHCVTAVPIPPHMLILLQYNHTNLHYLHYSILYHLHIHVKSYHVHIFYRSIFSSTSFTSSISSWVTIILTPCPCVSISFLTFRTYIYLSHFHKLLYLYDSIFHINEIYLLRHSNIFLDYHIYYILF